MRVLLFLLSLTTPLAHADEPRDCINCQSVTLEVLDPRVAEALQKLKAGIPQESDQVAPSQFTAYDRENILEWLGSEHPRGNARIKNRIAEGNRMQYCAAAGCPTKIPFEFSREDIDAVAAEMRRARRDHDCNSDTPACERLALQFATRKMDQIVRDKKLRGMSQAELEKRTVDRVSGGDNNDWINRVENGQQFLRDCVDQSANGTSFFLILGNNGLIRHHRILAPGLMHLGLQPHWFSRIETHQGERFRFDLYRSPRTDFEKLPGIQRRD